MTHPLRHYIQPGLDAVRALWVPFVLIQGMGLVLVLAYFFSPRVAEICDKAGEVKSRFGLLFAAIAMPIACGVVPELFKFAAGVDRSLTRRRLELTLHNMGLFCVAGVILDCFYMALGHAFVGVDPVIAVPSKVLIDQFLYSPFIGIPIITYSYTLRDVGYRPLVALRHMNLAWYERDVLPVLVTCWAYWFPMTSLMYTLPPKLTFVYGMVASAASSVLLVAVAGRDKPTFGDAHT